MGRLGTATTIPTNDPVPYLFDDNPLPVEAGKTYWLVVNGPPGSGGAIMGLATTNSTPSGLFAYNGYFFTTPPTPIFSLRGGVTVSASSSRSKPRPRSVPPE